MSAASDMASWNAGDQLPIKLDQARTAALELFNFSNTCFCRLLVRAYAIENAGFALRKPPFYPLNYGNWNQRSECDSAELTFTAQVLPRPRFVLDGLREAELLNCFVFT
jgi:hypothetical protein